MRIDSHQHFWTYAAEKYPWMTEKLAVLREDRLPEHLKPHLETHKIGGTVAVQARQTLQETQWLLELAGQNSWIRGVVGWVDLRSEDLEKQLNQFAGEKKFVGVRHVAQDEPDDQFLARPELVRGVSRLTERGLTYDLLVFPRQLSAAIQLVRSLPEQKFVLDHIAKPLIQDRVLEPWATQIRELAKAPNVWCKVSGMVTEANWQGWQTNDFRPFLDVVFESFGPDRLMYGSDWPVCLLAGSYDRVVNLAESYFAQFKAEEREKMMGGNAVRFYGLK